MSSIIPKIIHYCWFGKKEKPLSVVECIKSWENHLPDYQIIEWNEENFDIHSNEYVEQAYLAGKYAFVSDFVRLKALYQHGGVYMDTDVEVLKNLDIFLDKQAFSGFESNNYISAGIMGCIKSHPWIRSLISYYSEVSFRREDGSLDTTTNTQIITNITKTKHGLEFGNHMQILNVEGKQVFIYPSEYFCPKDWKSKVLNVTKNTYTIHHFAGSWLPKKPLYEKLRNKALAFSRKSIKRILGSANYMKVKQVFKNIRM